MSDLENKDCVAILVAVKTEAKRAIRVNVTLPKGVLKQIDAFAEAHGQTSAHAVNGRRHPASHEWIFERREKWWVITGSNRGP